MITVISPDNASIAPTSSACFVLGTDRTDARTDVRTVAVPRTAAGRRAVRRRQRKVAARGPAGAALAGARPATSVTAEREPIGAQRGYHLGRWARLATTVTVATVLIVAVLTLTGGQTRIVTVPVTVAPGDTLWTLARAAQPDADPAAVEDAIRSANELSGDTLRIGQVLQVPSAR